MVRLHVRSIRCRHTFPILKVSPPRGRGESSIQFLGFSRWTDCWRISHTAAGRSLGAEISRGCQAAREPTARLRNRGGMRGRSDPRTRTRGHLRRGHRGNRPTALRRLRLEVHLASAPSDRRIRARGRSARRAKKQEYYSRWLNRRTENGRTAECSEANPVLDVVLESAHEARSASPLELRKERQAESECDQERPLPLIYCAWFDTL